MHIEPLYELYTQHPSISTDTRKLQHGDLFFALSGPTFNGNTFASKALELGASYAIVDQDVALDDDRLLRVENVLETLQLLAKYHREQFDIPFIAITGSNGKTTTKELVSTVLSSHFTTYTTQGNLNNHIGVPLTLLSVKADAQMAVIEMGANHQREIAGYCEYAEPSHGIITNVGKAHLEGFGGEAGVRKGKGELFDYLRAHHGSVFIFNDYDYLREMSAGIDEVLEFGTANGLVSGNATGHDAFLSVFIKTNDFEGTVHTQLVGDYNLPNVLCAFAVGKYFGVPVEKIVAAISQYVPGNSRSQMMVKGTNHIILDAYNANPTSMKAAIENFAKTKSEKKVLMLGGMMELGKDSLYEHEQIVALMRKYEWNAVALVGGDFEKVTHPYVFFSNADEAGKWLSQQRFEHTHFLLKGSRTIGMEKVLQHL